MKAERLPQVQLNYRNLFIYLLIATLLSVAVYLSIADSVTNPSASQPIEVDGTTTPGEYGGAAPTGFVTGSLYQAHPNDPKATNILTAVSGFVVGERNRKTIFKIESKVVTSVAPNRTVAEIVAPVVFNNSPTFALLKVTTGANSQFLYSATIDDDGVMDSDPLTADVVGTSYVPERIGINLAASLASTAFYQPVHLVVEGAISERARAEYRSGLIVANFYTADGAQRQIVSAVVSVDAGANTNSNTDHLPILVDISMSSTIDLQKNGNIPVTVETTSFFDAQTMDPASIRLYPSVEASLAYPAGGAVAVNSETVLKPNGQRDLRLFFTTEALRNAGFESGLTTDVVLVGLTNGTPAEMVKGFTTVKTLP